MQLSGYALKALREDKEFILFRGRHGPADTATILLRAPVSARPALETLKKLEHAYSLRNELDASWAARPLALSQYNERRVLVLEDPGGEPLNRLIDGPMEIKQFLRFAVGLATALSRLHQRELIHKDLKPSNILVDPATGQVWLTGFGIASRVPREHQVPQPPEFIAGTLPYMAPEQTGRMNRSIDSRSDLYALGITLYEMLTGRLPFTAADPMGWVHCHIARQPVPPIERLSAVPASVSAIIMKLLAKTAEERYQTAAGAESDLRRCLAEWETHGHIDEFPPGQKDTPDRLLIPERLYGRAREIDTLLTAFDRIVAGGRPELVLVSGYSGIGKSAVVNELHKALVPPRGLFASGKFDQYKRDIPYATLAQAFQSLIRPLLSKSEAELGRWRQALHAALDPNGLLIVDLVPELKLIIGEQPPVPELPPQVAQGRFQLVFRRFISVFARPEHPLALFLDDLQWLDAATLDLLEDLLTRPDIQHLLLIGAYRDNEVSPSHPLMRKLEAMRRAGAVLRDIVLAPLTREDLGQLIADSLYCEPKYAASLTQLIHDKTSGNPFFAIQFISALAEEGLLTFDHGEGRWSWDLNRIHAKGYTDNVVDLMVGKLNRLPVETQSSLQQLACLGNSAEFATLQMVYQGSNQEMHGQLWGAVRAGLVFRSQDSYRFLHDRVQEAAYSLIPEGTRAEAHLRIGMLLAEHTSKEERGEVIFEIVNQLNRGSHLITSAEKREVVAELNLIAGRRAKSSTAYASALKYLAAGRDLLSEETWDRNYELIFAIEYLMAECELLTADMVGSENRLSMLAERARSGHDIAIVTRLRLTLYTALDRSNRGVEVCLEYLRRVGTDWSPTPTHNEVMREYDRIWSLVGSRQIEELVDLPLMTNPDILDVLDVLTEVVTPALFCDENLCSLVLCHMVNLSLEYGNCDGSCFAYVWFAIIAGPRFNNYKDGFRFGQLGYELVEKRGLTRYQARTYFSFGNIVIPWARHVRTGRDLVRRAFEAAYRIGDFTFAAYSCNGLITNFFAAGDSLGEVQPEAEKDLAFAQRARFGLIVDIILSQLQFVRTLRGLTPTFGCFNDEGFDELEFERHLESNPVLMLTDFFYSTRKLQARFFAGDYATAVEASLRAQQLLWTSPSQFETAEFRFYSALSHAAAWDSAPPDQRRRHFEALSAHHRQLTIWAEHCPENFENRAALVAAEIARIEGRALDAEQLYEQAIRSAHINGFIHNEALANDRAAHFYLARGFEKIAYAYLQDARYGYLRWGATAKVRQIDSLYPQLREERAADALTSTIGAPLEHLDLGTVIKVSQVISEMDLDKLIETVMRTAMEHAGAERGLLILMQGDGQRIEAEATTIRDRVAVRRGESALSALPQTIVNYVVRTHELVIQDDPSSENRFASDTYFCQHHVRSVLCLPLIAQGKLVAVLYLENSLAPHVFTPDRVAVVKLLASQAAISLENTRLYVDLREREAKIRRLVDANIIGICMWNVEGEIIEANEAFLKMVGYDRESFRSAPMRWTEMTPPEWRANDARVIAELNARGTTKPFEKELFRKDGIRVPILVGAALLQTGGNEGVAFVLDLSQQKRSEESHRVVVETANDAVISADENGLILLANPATERVFGYDPTELIGKPLTTLMPEYLRKLHEVGFKRYLETGRRHLNWQGTELVGLRKNGKEFPVEVSFGELTRDAHRVFTAFIRDISERKRAEETLRRTESYLTEAQRLAHLGSWVWQVADRKALYLSEEWYRVYGLDPQNGMPPWEERLRRIHPEDREKWQRAIERAIAEKSDYDVEFRIVLSPGAAVRYIHTLGHPVLDQSGELVQFVGVSMDVTDRKRAEEERERVRQWQADLAHVNRVSTMGELTASLAHEIKQPISAAVLNAKTCLRCLGRVQPDVSEAQEAATRLIKDATRASDIISRIGSLFKKDVLQWELVDINELIREMISLLRSEAARYSISIHGDLANDLPQIMADRVQIQQVLMNLMLNGIEAMRDINTQGQLTIKSRQDENRQLLVSVADTGAGLRSDQEEKIFNAFFTSKPQGTGMGLPISRSIVESHGGRLWATSNTGRGATFEFTLPLKAATHEAA